MDNKYAVEAKGLVKKFGNNIAVNHIDLQIKTGTIFGVLGPNGAGKTTTMNMLATLLKPDDGTATIFGHDIKKEPHIIRQLIGLTGQYASLDEKLTADENLMIFSRLQGLSKTEAKNKTAQLLASFGLAEAHDRVVSKFSGGMRRRLDLAASLISQPPLIFLDEPTTGLDPRTRGQMWETIRELVNNGSTILLTTQYLDEADQLADKIAVIDQGQVVAEGTTDQLKSSVGTASLTFRITDKDKIGEVQNILEKTLGNKGNLSPEAARITVPMDNPDKLTDILISLRSADIHVDEVSVQKPTLDEVFLTITGKSAETEQN